MANARRLMELTLPEPTAVELAAQIEAQTGDADRLIGVGVIPELATELSAQIDAAGTINAPKLVELSMIPELAIEVAAQITADRI